MKNIRVAINGFGRIGRTVARAMHQREGFDLIAINDISPIETMCHLLQYDSTHGRFPAEVKCDKTNLSFGKMNPTYFSQKNISDLPWSEIDVDVVLECTGKFNNQKDAELHLNAGAKKVILSAPSSDDLVKTIVVGVNEDLIAETDRIISCASCTTNNAAPMIQLLNELCDIESCYITTVHSYTLDQRLQDAPHKDLRRGRAANMSIVPTTTGAAKALTKIFPDLSSSIGGCGIRVPVHDGSLTDITCIVKNPLSVEDINQRFKEYAGMLPQGVFKYTEAPIVGIDVVGEAYSCVFDALLTSVIGNMVKVVGWYDNETGYSNRLLDATSIFVSKK